MEKKNSYYFRVSAPNKLHPPSFKEGKRNTKSPCDSREHAVGSGKVISHVLYTLKKSGKIIETVKLRLSINYMFMVPKI